MAAIPKSGGPPHVVTEIGRAGIDPAFKADFWISIKSAVLITGSSQRVIAEVDRLRIDAAVWVGRFCFWLFA